MARGCRRCCGWPRSCSRRSLHGRWRNRWTRRLGYDRAGRGRNLRGLGRWNDDRLWNNWRRRSLRGLGFHGARCRHGRAARLGNSRSGGRRNHESSRQRSCHRRLHTSCSGSCVLRRLIRYCLLFGLRFGFGDGAKMLAHLYCGFHLDRTGMRFFLGDAGFGQIINDGLCLDLELTSQFVDSDLIRIGHCPPGRLLVSVLV
jgi:hypothetical protein